MEKTMVLAREEFESSSCDTEQFRTFRRTFKREFTRLLKKVGAVAADIHNGGHFEIGGFFKLADGRIYYFSVGDMRWNKSRMLIRTAKDFKDYTGGHNEYLPFDLYFERHFLKFLEDNKEFDKVEVVA